MKREYDFSRGECGRFSRPDANLNLPVYLDDEARGFVEKIAKNRRADVSTVVNDLIKSDMRLAEAMK